MTATCLSRLEPSRLRAIASRCRWPALIGAIGALAVAGGRGPLTAPKAIVLGAVEGITEYLPISSTGHLLVAQRLLGLGTGAGKAAADTYAVAIQVGAITAVLVLYRTRLLQMCAGIAGRDALGRNLLIRLAIAFMPAALAGAALDHTIKDHLFRPVPVVVAWALGGALLLVWVPRSGTRTIDMITASSAAMIGAAQVLALWPGVSRSLVTIVAALALGCELAAALEFSFLLGLATLAAATTLNLVKDGPTLLRDYGWQMPLLGVLVAFATAVIAVRWLVSYLRARPISPFGWYRIAVAIAAIGLLANGAI